MNCLLRSLGFEYPSLGLRVLQLTWFAICLISVQLVLLPPLRLWGLSQESLLFPHLSIQRVLLLSERPAIRSLLLLSLALFTSRLLGNRLQGSERSVDERIERAWTAGQWAGAVLQERVHPPNRTPPLDLRSRFYAVAKCEGLESPTIYKSSGSYWRRIGSLEGSHSISQSFPSEAESIIYLRAAGFREEEIQVLPYFLQRWRCQWI